MSFTLKKIVLPVTLAFCAISASAATYTQTVPGHNGPMTVKVAIDSGKITAVEVVKHNETPGVGTKAIETLPAKIVKANSTKVDAVTGATPLALVKEGLAQGLTVDQIISANPDLTYGQMLFARAGGSAGEASALAIILGFIYLLARRVIRPHIPVTIILTVAVMTGIFWLIDPSQYTDPLFNILTGGVLLGSVFMATDYVTSPMTVKGMVIYGIGIGVLTVLIRYFGSYPEGVSFAILIMNSIVPLLNKYVKPARFGKEVNHA